MTSSWSAGINYMGPNEVINMIYNFMTFFWNILAFTLCFPENLSSYTNYDLQQVDKACLCKWRWNIYLVLSTWLLQNLTTPAGSPVDLMSYCNQITTSSTNHCFNLFYLVVFTLFMPCSSLCCTVTLLMLQLYYL